MIRYIPLLTEDEVVTELARKKTRDSGLISQSSCPLDELVECKQSELDDATERGGGREARALDV